MSELKKCPFCGGEATISDGGYSGEKFLAHCRELSCLAASGFFRKTHDEAVAAWNRRAQPENEPLTCKDCVYWKDRQVQLRDGSCRDYLPNEPWSVTADVGINVASHCTLHGFDNESGSWFWAKAEDFCSRGIRKPERSEGQ